MHFKAQSSALIQITELVLLLLTAATTTHARSWQLQTTHQGTSFFNGFSFFNSPDPTHGFVDYVDQHMATKLDLIDFDEDEDDDIVVIKSGPVSNKGRASIRIQSDTTYNQGLFLFDVEHMPAGCGTWPAIWLNGPDWPNGGEIDVRAWCKVVHCMLNVTH